MNVTALQDMVERPKFRPLTLQLNDGSKVNVKHPDFLMFTEGRSTVIVTEGEHVHIIDVNSITAIKTQLK